MTAASTGQDSALNKILASLGMTLDDLEECAASDGYRIEFEQNFTIELQHIKDSKNCRISTRIFNLGKSLQVQENQIKRALDIFSELLEEFPLGMSMAVSNHDNCLRICIEIMNSQTESIMTKFHEFVHLAFAYKQTYFKHKS